MSERASPSRSGPWLGIFVERRDTVAGELWCVTISAAGRDARCRLFPDHPAAYGFALDQAEVLELPLFDHADAGVEA